jgi:hypothetical protein
VIQHNSELREDFVRRKSQRLVGAKVSRSVGSFEGNGMDEAQTVSEMTLNESVYEDGL